MNKKSPSNPIYEKNTHDFARRVLARSLNLNTQFKSADTQWHMILTALANVQPVEDVNANSI